MSQFVRYFVVFVVGVVIGALFPRENELRRTNKQQQLPAAAVEDKCCAVSASPPSSSSPSVLETFEDDSKRSRFPRRGAKVEAVVAEIRNKFGPAHVTDKFLFHDYASMFERILEPYVSSSAAAKPFRLLEIGLGCEPGYFSCPLNGFRFFKTYAPHVDYFGVDVHRCSSPPASLPAEDREYLQGRIFQGNQIDFRRLDEIIRDVGAPFDVIIDDGSHHPHWTTASFLHLFRHGLRPGGVMCVEDLSFTQFTDTPAYRKARQQNPKKRAFVKFITDLVAQMQIPFHYVLDKKISAELKAHKISVRPLVDEPFRNLTLSSVVRWVRSIDIDREICCVHKLEAPHRFPVPCEEGRNECRIPQEFLAN